MYYTIDTQYCALAKAKEGVRQAALQTVDTALDRQDTAELFRLMEESNELFDAVKMRLDRIMAFITAEEFDALLLRMSEKEQLLDRAENAMEPKFPDPDKRGRFSLPVKKTDPPPTYIQYRGVFCLYPSWCQKLGYRGIRIRGSLVSCAVALNRPDLLSLLLQGGYSAKPFASVRLIIFWDREACPSDLIALQEESIFGIYLSIPYSSPDEKAIWKRDLSGMSLSPLSLAILLGRTECVRTLLDHGSDCFFSEMKALHLCWRMDDADYRATRNAAFAYKAVQTYIPPLSAFSESTLQQFRQALSRYDYNRWAYQSFLRCPPLSWDHFCRKVLAMDAAKPALLTEPYMLWPLLEQIFSYEEEDFDLRSLLPLLAGKQLDMRYLPWNHFSPANLRRLLPELSRHAVLTSARSHLGIEQVGSVQRLQLLLKYLQLSDGDERYSAVSALSDTILRLGNGKLLRTALTDGTIPESTKVLMEHLQRHPDCPAASREALLTTDRSAAVLPEDSTIRQKNAQQRNPLT